MDSGPKESNGVEHLHTLVVPKGEGCSVKVSFQFEERREGRGWGTGRGEERWSF